MIYQLGFFSDIGYSIRQAIRTLCGRLAAILYEFIVQEYNVFMYIARADILDSNFIQNIYNKVGTLLGIFMLFKLSFSLIKSLVDPAQFNDPKNGFSKIIQRSIISIVLLGITPSLFEAAFDLQNIIVGAEKNGDNRNNIIYKFVAGGTIVPKTNDFGRMMASDLYFSFFKEAKGKNLNLGTYLIETPDGPQLEADNYGTLKENVTNGNVGFDTTVDYLMLRSEGTYIIEFNELFSIGVAIVVIWILIIYCIQIATRVIQLAYLQLIAPIPILSYISNPEGTFKNWLKQCSTTYLDLFIRLAIIYFIIALANHIFKLFDAGGSELLESTGLTEDNPALIWVKIFLIIGLLMFGKRVPELLKELFPNMGGGAASLGFGPKLPKEVSGFAKGAATLGLGAVVGGAAGLATGIKHGEGIKGKIAGAFGGLGRGMTSSKTKGNIFKNAQAGMNSTRAARQRAYEKNHDGSTFWGRNVTAGSAARTKDEFDRQIAANDTYVNTIKLIEAETDKDARVISATNNLNSISSKGRATQAITVNGRTYAAGDRIASSDINDAITEAQKNLKKQRIACVEDVYNGTSTNGALTSLVNSAGAQVMKNSEKGFEGFGSVTVTSGTGQIDYSSASTASSTDKAEGLFAYKSAAAADTGNIKNTGGSKNEAYKRAEANAKYNKSGK